MFDMDSINGAPIFSLAKHKKAEFYANALHELTRHHYANCRQYRKILDTLGFDTTVRHAIEDMPFIPARLFKDFELTSVDKSQITKTMSSSGTTGQKASRVFLDDITAANQTKVLARIVSDFIGAKRLPMLIIDARPAIKDRGAISARAAGILGFSMFGYDHVYALDGDLRFDFNAVKAFCDKYKDENILIFGFTYMIWEYFYKKLAETGRHLALKNAILIHGGGWKKLSEQAVNNDAFKRSLESACGVKRVHNYYGMVEQAGSIFMECEKGYLHASIFSDVIMRRADFSACGAQEAGLIQVMSVLPLSYPGHSILTEDSGEIIGEDDCPCSRLGKYFKVRGRIKGAELRGCSDAHA